MKNLLATRIAPNAKVSLSQISPEPPKPWNKESSAIELHALGEELNRLQELLYAAGTHSLLIVLQGMDTSGKDGAIRGVMKYVNPQGCRVESFKTPTDEELAHDFLWRVHQVTPRKGMVAVFNRSHYEDVLIARVQKLVPDAVWKQRYEQINDFEKMLAQNNTIIVKCFLHISKQEQAERLLAREKEIEKAWKLSVGDWQQRELWSSYQRAYSDALTHCSTPHAPWFALPSNKKWFRNLVLAQLLAETLRPYQNEWGRILAARSKAGLAALEKWRNGQSEK